MIKDIHLFVWNLLVKSLFIKKWTDTDPTYTQELEAIDQLTALLEENDPEDLLDSIDLETMVAPLQPLLPPPPYLRAQKRSQAFTQLPVQILMLPLFLKQFLNIFKKSKFHPKWREIWQKINQKH